MKSVFFLSVLFLTSPAFAFGLDCMPADGGNIEILTGESAVDGDSVTTLGIIIPDLQNSAFVFQRDKDEVNVTRSENSAVYMASDRQGNSVTLIWNKGKDQISSLYARIHSKIYSAELKCVGPAGE